MFLFLACKKKWRRRISNSYSVKDRISSKTKKKHNVKYKKVR